MEYIKFHIDEDDSQQVFCVYRDLSKGKQEKKIVRSFPLSVIGEKEPKLLEMVEGDITDVYYEERSGECVATEVKYFNNSMESIAEKDIDWIRNFVKCACVNEDFDDLIAPPSVDQQVEDFIKEFFDESDGFEDITKDDQPLQQKDFLAEFFAELEEDSE